jgi:hypothetical protein
VGAKYGEKGRGFEIEISVATFNMKTDFVRIYFYSVFGL